MILVGERDGRRPRCAVRGGDAGRYDGARSSPGSRAVRATVARSRPAVLPNLLRGGRPSRWQTPASTRVRPGASRPCRTGPGRRTDHRRRRRRAISRASSSPASSSATSPTRSRRAGAPRPREFVVSLEVRASDVLALRRRRPPGRRGDREGGSFVDWEGRVRPFSRISPRAEPAERGPHPRRDRGGDGCAVRHPHHRAGAGREAVVRRGGRVGLLAALLVPAPRRRAERSGPRGRLGQTGPWSRPGLATGPGR